ncbi:hypothetical protein ILUMI_04045 [Ignelater luminosus]|uniref:Farnesol dehydrogenase-like n=1 Tax=Ignelater luminosus TaxID=2038154 RepID=A0A8K0DFG6_IGNLU|nr:hypothetical protein ILUMI_04045 [Ignelater luminosus]
MVISMERWKRKVAVVTGASSGIGAAIVGQLVESGLKVVGLARSRTKLEELSTKLENKNGKFYAFRTDITKEEDIVNAFEWIKKNLGPVHILVNSAGILRYDTLVDGNTNFWKEVLETNVLGLCIATREAVKDMKANNVNGHIVHINSISGHKVTNVPTINVYAASKHAVTALTETLRQELDSIGSKIKISSISPGCVDTGIFEATAKGSGLPGIPAERAAMLNKIPKLQARDVADGVLYVLATPPHVQVHELTIKPLGELM